MVTGRQRILVTGGGTFIGNHIAAALLAEGADVQLLVRPGPDVHLGGLRDEVEWAEGDVWNPASLKGRARKARTVIHTVGGSVADPSTGLTFHYLNVLSLRNVADMCISDGAPHLLYVSAASAPWFPRGYTRSKREGEAYLKRVGLRSTVVRAPLVFQRGAPRPIVFRLVNLIAAITPFFRRSAPLPVDVFARGIARLALEGSQERTIFFRSDLNRLNTRAERRGLPMESLPIPEPPPHEDDTRPNPPVNV